MQSRRGFNVLKGHENRTGGARKRCQWPHPEGDISTKTMFTRSMSADSSLAVRFSSPTPPTTDYLPTIHILLISFLSYVQCTDILPPLVSCNA